MTLDSHKFWRELADVIDDYNERQTWLNEARDGHDLVERELCLGQAAMQGMNIRVGNSALPENSPLRIPEREINAFVLGLAKQTYGRVVGRGEMPYESRNEQFRSTLEFAMGRFLDRREQ